MTEYVVLLPGNEAAWAAATEQQKAEMYATHREFGKLLAERGHRVTGGNELLARAGRADEARAAYDVAIGRCANDAERAHLEERRAVV